MQAARDDRSLGQILKELRDETSVLLRQEVQLAKTELTENVSRAGKDAGAIAVGGAVAFLGALALLAFAIRGLSTLMAKFLDPDIAVWLAPLLIGLVLAGVGYSMIKKALTDLKQNSLAPTRTTQSLKENKEWLQAKIK